MGDGSTGEPRGASESLIARLRRPVTWIRGWAVWGLRRRVLAYVLCVETIAVVAALFIGFRYSPSGVDWTRAGVLAACAMVHIEATRTIEKQSKIAAGVGPYLDQKSVWNFAALLILPPALATAMVVFTYAYMWMRIWRHSPSYSCYRWTYSAATVVLATQVSVAVLARAVGEYPGLPNGLSEMLAVVGAGGIRWLVNYGLVLVVFALSQPRPAPRELLSSFKDQFMEAGALAFGFCAAALLVFHSAYVLAPVVALLALQRTSLVTRYRRAAQTDAKTGLLNSASWRTCAEQVIEQGRSTGARVGVLMADLDHFKAVNDTYGHPTGDEVLVAVAGTISGQIRDDIDMACRFGGEEFAVLLPGMTEQELLTVAERIRRHVGAAEFVVNRGDGSVETIGVTVSIGGVVFPCDGAGLDELVLRADNALYAAKRLGRNRVCLHGEA